MKRYRHIRILSILEERPAVSVSELAKELLVSVGTIRRDLAQLQQAGQLKRVHGGAFAAIQGEGGFSWRTCLNMDRKCALGKAAAGLIPSGSVVFIDGGTTTEAMLPYLYGKTSLTVVTCGLNDGPFFALIALGLSGHANVPWQAVVGTIIPFIAGFNWVIWIASLRT